MDWMIMLAQLLLSLSFFGGSTRIRTPHSGEVLWNEGGTILHWISSKDLVLQKR